jgi:hypothetical protein
MTAHCSPRQIPRYGLLLTLAQWAAAINLALHAPLAKSAGDEDALALAELLPRLVVTTHVGEMTRPRC